MTTTTKQSGRKTSVRRRVTSGKVEPGNATPGEASEVIKRPKATPFRFGLLVHDVSRMRRTLFDDVMRPLGVTRSQWSVLVVLSRMGSGGMMQVDLSRRLDVGKVTIGGLIDRLEAAGYVERQPDPNDRRARRVYVTESGFKVIAEIQKAGAVLNRDTLAGVTSEELKITEAVLAKVKANIRAMLQTA